MVTNLAEQKKLKSTFQPEKGGKIIPRNWGKDLGTESSKVPKGKGEDSAKPGGMVRSLFKRELGHPTPRPLQATYLIPMEKVYSTNTQNFPSQASTGHEP